MELRESIGQWVAGQLPGHSGPFDCTLCPRSGLPDEMAFWQHMRDRHKPSEFTTNVSTFGERIEDALVRIVNSATHEEAIAIATAALLEGSDD